MKNSFYFYLLLLYNYLDMAKLTLKEAWTNIKSQIVKPHIRQEAFLFFSAIIFTFAMLMVTIVNFINDVTPLKWLTLGYFIALFAMEIVEFIIFSFYKRPKLWPFVILTFSLSFSMAMHYLFLAPCDTLYLFWICLVPVMYFICFGNKHGFLPSLVLFIIFCLVFFVPALNNLTRAGREGGDDHIMHKVFFILYYVACCFLGMMLSLVNNTIIKKLDVVKDSYYEDANTDVVTGLRNQAFFLSYINRIPQKCKVGETIGLMFIDIDDFKIYNDKYGHTIGNEVLVEVANRLNQVPHDLLVRWGGDEFAIVERNLTRDEFIAKANFLLKSVEGIHNGVTISIGLAFYVIDENFNFEKIFNEADMQAIRAKGKGKNCVVINN